jgi:hypothetical protein
MKEKPNFYSVLPATVRYSEDLTYFEKVLYSEITALSNSQGYCWASNSYFAELYKKTIAWVSNSISKLEKMGFITLEIDKEKGNKRKIYIDPIKENYNSPIKENYNSPIIENYKNNITRKNNTSFNRKRVKIVPDWHASYREELKQKLKQKELDLNQKLDKVSLAEELFN